MRLSSVQLLQISAIRPPRFRLRDDVGSLEELKASIKSVGLLEPIVVRKVNSHYEIIAGQRRFLSAHELGWSDIEAKIIVATDQQAFEFALIENIHRKSMDPLEEGVAFHAYIHKYGYGSNQDLALRMDMSLSYISSRLTLVDLSDDIKGLVKSNKLSVTNASELSKVRTEEVEQLANISATVGLNTKQMRSAVNLVNQGMTAEQASQTVVQWPDWDIAKTHKRFNPISVARKHIVAIIDQAYKSVCDDMNMIPEGKELAKWNEAIRYPLHQLVDMAMRLEKEYEKK